MVKASGPGRRNPMIKIRELVSTVGSLRYEEVDGVRKEKERLTTDHLSPRGEDWSLTFRFLVLSYTSAKGARAERSDLPFPSFLWALAKEMMKPL